MHGVLSLAALHLAYQHPELQAKYLQLCDKHQSAALSTFRTVLSGDISPELADALFALSAVLSISSMGRSCVANNAATVDMDAIAEIFFLTRGVRDVIHMHYARIREGPMQEMFENQRYAEGTKITLPQSIAVQFEDIRQMLAKSGLDSEALNQCEEALTELEDVYQNVMYFGQVTDVETGQIFRW